MTCSICTTAIKEDLKIESIEYNPQVAAYETYTINVTVKSVAWAYGDTAKLCLYDRSTGELISSLSEHMGPGTSRLFVFNEQMSDHDLNLNLSLIDENVWPIADDCEDYRNFTIKIGEYTEPPKPPGPNPDDLFQLIVLGVVVSIIVALIVGKLK